MGLTGLMDAGANAPVRRRRRRWLGCLPVLLVLALVVTAGVYYLNNHRNLIPIPLAEGCTASTVDGIVSLDVDQMANAGTITAVSIARNLPQRAATIALATAMQESKLENLTGGDLDSIGLFQQRPSEGWGSSAQISDPVYSTDKFLDRLVEIPGYAELPLTVAAQDVQHSAYPDAYAQHETDATVLSDALTGETAAGLTCQVNSVGTAPAGTGAKTLEGSLLKEFGQVVSPRVVAARATASAAPADPQVAVSARSGLTSSGHRDWAVAQWAVAHSQDLHIASVGYAGQLWTADDSAKGWQPAASGTSSRSVLISVAEH